jgi:hypothetical protein
MDDENSAAELVGIMMVWLVAIFVIGTVLAFISQASEGNCQ